MDGKIQADYNDTSLLRRGRAPLRCRQGAGTDAARLAGLPNLEDMGVMVRLHHTNMSLNDIAWTFEVEKTDFWAMEILIACTEPLQRVSHQGREQHPDGCAMYPLCGSLIPTSHCHQCMLPTALLEGPLVRGTYDDTERAELGGHPKHSPEGASKILGARIRRIR